MTEKRCYQSGNHTASQLIHAVPHQPSSLPGSVRDARRGLILNPLIDVSFRSPFAQRVAFLLRRRKPKYRDSLLITQASSAGSDHDTKSASEGKPDRDTCPSSPSHSQSLHIAFGSSRDKYPRESSSLARSRKPARLVGADGVYCPPCCAFPRPPVCQRVCSRSFRCGGRPGLATR
jgi:hypothetical protein